MGVHRYASLFPFVCIPNFFLIKELFCSLADTKMKSIFHTTKLFE